MMVTQHAVEEHTMQLLKLLRYTHARTRTHARTHRFLVAVVAQLREDVHNAVIGIADMAKAQGEGHSTAYGGVAVLQQVVRHACSHCAMGIRERGS